jgi:hypothetical protein
MSDSELDRDGNGLLNDWDRAMKAKQSPGGPLYYIFNMRDITKGWNDGCIVWWKANGNGYTNYIEDAGIFEEWVKEKYKGSPELMFVPVEVVTNIKKTRSYVWRGDLVKVFNLGRK